MIDYYQRNRLAILQRNAKRRREDPAWRRKQVLGVRRAALKRRQRILAFIIKLKDKPCKDCRERHPHFVMDFDHVRGRKLFSLGHAPNLNKTEAEILREVKKCEVVCSNCHRTRTHTRRMDKFKRAA